MGFTIAGFILIQPIAVYKEAGYEPVGGSVN